MPKGDNLVMYMVKITAILNVEYVYTFRAILYVGSQCEFCGSMLQNGLLVIKMSVSNKIHVTFSWIKLRYNTQLLSFFDGLLKETSSLTHF